MGARARFGLCALLAAILCGCVEAKTTSAVSSADIPADKYRKVIVFVETSDEADHLLFEQLVATALQRAGVQAQSSLEVFNYSREVSGDDMAALIRQQNFQAALYVKVLREDLELIPVPNVTRDGQMFHSSGSFGPFQYNSATSVSATYSVTQDGHVVRPVLHLAIQSQMQDVWSAKQVWAAQTDATLNAKVGSVKLLVEQSLKQVVEKMQADRAI